MTTERRLSEIVEDILVGRPNGEAPIGTLIHEIPNRIALTAGDYQGSVSRPNEAIWEQRVRNITSHKGSSRNFIYRGFLEQIDGGLRITAAGRVHQQARNAI
ncbi:hypothetical protein [Mesorhizobium sp. SARCC-RB16n]|uniref:hypothetical protein n=1 Tax=Mesorhizobium sp. SARCC-RB16n TaxID=2116687 RepID=UPI00122ED98F|nr:hypothetical protein [Mesorhizobium sp. SARCC-RB16n]